MNPALGFTCVRPAPHGVKYFRKILTEVELQDYYL